MDISPWASTPCFIPPSMGTMLIVTMQIPCGLAMGSLVLCLVLLLFSPDLPDPLSVELSPKPHEEHELRSSDGLAKGATIDGLLNAISDAKILLVIPVFFVGIFRYTTLNILIQYASIQFGMKISTGATFYTETAVVNIVLFLFLIPRMVSYIRLRYQKNPEVIDLFLVRFSVCIMCIGCLCIGFAPSSKILPIGQSHFLLKYAISVLINLRRGLHLLFGVWKSSSCDFTSILLDNR